MTHVIALADGQSEPRTLESITPASWILLNMDSYIVWILLNMDSYVA